MLLVARAVKENVRPYLMKGAANIVYAQLYWQYVAVLESLTVEAENGDRDAEWILENLEQMQD